jgi:acetyl-CoA carboxylase biotin carboxyl carrier protein
VDIDLDELIALVELLKDAEFSEFRYEKGDLRIVIRRGGRSDEHELVQRASASNSRSETPRKTPASQEQGAPSTAKGPIRSQPPTATIPTGGVPVTAPVLGTFYTRPKPSEPPFVSVGSLVEADTVLCIIEVMKLMNSVVAGMRGTVAAIHVKEGELVEHGQLLYSIAPLSE